jgi:hypothetical protein
MARGDQVLRQWRLHQILEHARRGMSIDELREALDGRASRRTIYRDLAPQLAAEILAAQLLGRPPPVDPSPFDSMRFAPLQ